MELDKKTYEGKIIKLYNTKSGVTRVEISLDKYCHDLENLKCNKVKITTQEEYELIESIQEWIRLWVCDKEIYISTDDMFGVSEVSQHTELTKSHIKIIYSNLNKNYYYKKKEV